MVFPWPIEYERLLCQIVWTSQIVWVLWLLRDTRRRWRLANEARRDYRRMGIEFVCDLILHCAHGAGFDEIETCIATRIDATGSTIIRLGRADQMIAVGDVSLQPITTQDVFMACTRWRELYGNQESQA